MHLLNATSAAPRSLPIPGGTIHQAAIQHATPYLRSVPADPAPASDPTIRHHLAAHPALGALPEQDRNALLRWSRVRSLKRQEVICRQGDAASTVILVLEGYLKLSVACADGGEAFLDIAGPGDCAGAITALDRRAYDSDVTALSPARALMIDARQFWQTFERHPEALLAILRLATARLRRVTDQLAGIAGLPAPARLAKVLLRLTQLPAAGTDAALRLSQVELAVMTGVSRELINKQLREWRDAGWVRMSSGSVTSVHEAALTRVAEGEMDRDLRPSVAPQRRSAAMPAGR
jgi:CRP-like cAMP-binding protein